MGYTQYLGLDCRQVEVGREILSPQYQMETLELTLGHGRKKTALLKAFIRA